MPLNEIKSLIARIEESNRNYEAAHQENK